MKYEFAGMDKCKDRGLQKWQGFFMTEHNKELRDFYNEQNNEDWIGDLNGDYQLHINNIIVQIGAENKRATVKYHNGRKYEIVTGLILSYEEGLIELDTTSGLVSIHLDKVSSIE